MKKHNVSLEMDQGLFDHLVKRAKALNITRSELLRLLLREDLRRSQKILSGE